MELLWTDFLNSHWHDWRGGGRSEDRLEKPAWIATFLADRGLPAPVPPDPAVLEELKSFRTLLHRMAATLAAGTSPCDDDLRELNRVLAEAAVIRQVEAREKRYQMTLLPVDQGWPHVMAAIAASFASTLAEGEPVRVRICENPDCLWVFYDDTRNRTKRYCDDKMCGNLMKVRRFRARQKGSGV